jgi:8-oxo-dGTP diphosphatase
LAHSSRTPSHVALAAILRVRDRTLEVLLDGAALPSAELARRETLEAALGRSVELSALAHLEQLETRSEPRRTTRGWELATAYLGLAPADADLRGDWHGVLGLPRLVDDHAQVVAAAQARLRAKLSYTNLGFALAPDVFTISELREIFVAALGHDVSATNLQRVLVRRGVLEPVAGVRAPGRSGGRPAALFSFASRRIEVTDEFAALRPPR